jgi:hypothetical protein
MKIQQLVARCPGVQLKYEPFLIGGLFKTLCPSINYAVKAGDGKAVLFTQYGPVPWSLHVKAQGSKKPGWFAASMMVPQVKEREGIPIERSLAAGAPAVIGMRLCLAVEPERAGDICKDVHHLYHVEGGGKDMTAANLAPLVSAYGLPKDALTQPALKKLLADRTAEGTKLGLVSKKSSSLTFASTRPHASASWFISGRRPHLHG